MVQQRERLPLATGEDYLGEPVLLVREEVVGPDPAAPVERPGLQRREQPGAGEDGRL
jgi:hypothetical protein